MDMFHQTVLRLDQNGHVTEMVAIISEADGRGDVRGTLWDKTGKAVL